MKKSLRSICKDYKKHLKIPEYTYDVCFKSSLYKCDFKILDEEGFGFDTVSGGEIYTVHKAGVDMTHVLFNGSNKSYDELSL